MEQIVRDARIAMLYEGTTGIQALDLIGRKVLGSGGKLLMGFTELVGAFCDEHTDEADAEFINVLKCYKDDWLELSLKIGEKATQNPDEAGAAAVDYLMYSGYVTLAYFWARMAVLARQKIAAAEGDTSFYEAKLMTAKFYYERLLPRTLSHKQALLSGSDNLMTMPEDLFDVAASSVYLTAQIFLIVAFAGVYSWLLTVSGAAQGAVDLIEALNVSPWMLLLVINVFLLLVGTVLDTASAILVLTPLLANIASALGIDLVHFGIIVVMNLSIGTFTPPFGLNIFVGQAVFKVPLSSLYPGLVPFILISVGVLMVVTYLPGVSLWILQFI